MSEHVIDSIADERDRLREENEVLRKRIKRLEQAGDELEAFCSAEGALRKWRKAKE